MADWISKLARAHTNPVMGALIMSASGMSTAGSTVGTVLLLILLGAGGFFLYRKMADPNGRRGQSQKQTRQ